jgi:hypothetical protein
MKGQNPSKELKSAISIYLSKNVDNFQSDTLLIQTEQKLAFRCTLKKQRQFVILSYDSMPESYFKTPKFVLRINRKINKKNLTIILLENNFDLDSTNKNWTIAYLGQWNFFFNKVGKKYIIKKYTNSSI